jgi:O-antigen/teichoic acid export membrane protein
VVFPVLSVYHRERPKEMIDAVNRFYKALMLMGWPMAVGIFVLAHPLTPVLLGHEFLRSEPALRVLSLALGIAFVNNAFIGALNASDRQSSFTWAAAWSLVANLALNLTLIPISVTRARAGPRSLPNWCSGSRAGRSSPGTWAACRC